VRFEGVVLIDVVPRDRDIAMVFQSYALYPNMSIYDNIRFPLRMRGVPKGQHDRQIRWAADLVELSDFLDRLPGQLSGGQRQRAALARAIVREPRLFLMDEPLSNLDAKLRMTMRAQVKHIQRELKTTTIYVTHDQIEAMTLADRIVIMDQGQIQQVGTPDEVYGRPANAYVAGFIGSPPMNLLPGDVTGGQFVRPDTRVPDAPFTERTGVKLGIRPEDVEIVEPGQGHLQGSVYAVEPTGDQTMLSIDTGDQLVYVKAPRSYRQEVNTPVSVRFAADSLHYFDAESGARIDG
jgi:multiple sugar transport system ATP-binding protein